MNFTDTKALYLSARSTITGITDVIDGKHFLGVSGYYVFIRLDPNSSKGIRVELLGPATDINDIPNTVLNNYLTVKSEIQDWKNDLLPDFPDFSTRF